VCAQVGFDAIANYAHTLDVLKYVLITIDQIKSKAGNTITVLVCGGDQDKQKQLAMAQQVALKLSIHVILTLDNPHRKAPQDIIQDMQAGMFPVQQQQVLTIITELRQSEQLVNLHRPRICFC